MNKTDAFTFLQHTLALNFISAPLTFNRATKEFYLEVSTGAKSHLNLYFRDTDIFAEMRYSETDTFDYHDQYNNASDNDDLLYWVRSLLRKCLCGRDYAAMGVHAVLNDGWKTLDDFKNT